MRLFEVEIEHLSLAAEMPGEEFLLSGIWIGSESVSDDYHVMILAKAGSPRVPPDRALYPRHECRGFTARRIK